MGKYYSVNVPLRDGMDDASYMMLFNPIMTKIMENYQPGAVVLQVGWKWGMWGRWCRGNASGGRAVVLQLEECYSCAFISCVFL